MIITTATDLPRLMSCMGSYYMPAALPPDTDMQARDEGNAAHWLATQWFAGAINPVAGMTAYNGFIITDEMIEHVGSYLSALDAGEMEINTSHAGNGWEIGGRADHLVFRDNVLTIDEFKYGHRLVEAEGNWTLISHAIGWISQGPCGRVDTIRLRVHQPRAYHPDGPLREWTICYNELFDRAQQINAHLSAAPNVLNSTVEHCAKCHALATCPAARMASMNAIDASCVAFSDELPAHILTYELELLRAANATIENRYKALEELITHKIKSGETIQGYGLKMRYGNTRFKISDGKLLTALTGVDCVKTGTITPAEAKRRGISDAVMATLTERPPIGVKLEKVNIDRAARAAFGDGS